MKKMKVDKSEVKKISGMKNTIALLKKSNIKKSVYFWIFLIYFFSAIMAVGAALVGAKVTEKITQAQFNGFVVIVILAGVLSMLKMTFQNLQYIFNVKLNNMIVKAINTENYKQVLSLEISNFDKNSSEEFQNRIYAANQISTVIVNVFTNIYGIINSLAYTIIIFIYAPILSLLYCIYPVAKIIFNKIMNPRINALYNQNWKENGIKMTALSREAIIGIKDIKSLNIKKQIMSDYYKKQTEFYNQQENINTYEIKNRFFLSATTAIGTTLTLLTGYFLYENNMLTIVAFVLFMTYKSYIRDFFDQFSNLISCISNVEASAFRGHELYNNSKFPKEVFGEKKLEKLEGNIAIKNLNFTYNEKQVLFKNISFNIDCNKVTALVGRSGEGKSTVLSLINKFYKVENNKIFIDGVDINLLDEQSIRNNIAYIQQSPYIFNMTFKENLLLIKPDATDEEIVEICKKSEIYDFIMQTPDGFNTLIGENGITLSGGQKQRLAIARALLNNSKIIMFDESTSSLDNESQFKIQKVIEELKSNHTIIIVAHRLSTIVNADTIIYFKNHKIKDVGTHAELLNRCEDYRDLYSIEQTK